MIREDYFKMLHEQFNCEADYPFEGDFVTAVFRHPDSLKWFARRSASAFTKNL